MTAAYLSVVTQKLRLRLRMCVARVSYIYLMYTYINIYYSINTPSTYLCACVTC